MERTLRQPAMPENASIVLYADDLAIVIVERNPAMLKITLNITMRRVSWWMADHGLMLAVHKTELTLLTGKRISTQIPMTVGTEAMRIKDNAKYLRNTLTQREGGRDGL